MNSSCSSRSSQCKIASAAKDLIISVPQTAATTFAFSSVFILLLCFLHSTFSSILYPCIPLSLYLHARLDKEKFDWAAILCPSSDQRSKLPLPPSHPSSCPSPIIHLLFLSSLIPFCFALLLRFLYVSISKFVQNVNTTISKTGGTFGYIFCRDTELAIIENFMEPHIKNKKPERMYISGRQGTSKTVCVTQKCK